MSAKIRMQDERTTELLEKKEVTLTRRREMRAQNALARQTITERIDKMRQTSQFDVDDNIRAHIQNRELQELLERCDTLTGGAKKVSLDTITGVLGQMQSEGKLGAMGNKDGGSGGGGRPQSASTGRL